MASDPPAGSDTGNGASSEALIFVADASAEAERLTASLRARGYVTVDVPLGLLLGRVAVQRPAVVLCDADALDALDAIERMRDIPGGRSIDVLFLGEPGKTLDAQAERLARQGSGLFVRPVDVYALLRKVESLIGAPTHGGAARPSTVPQGSRVPVLVAATRRPYRYDTRARARNFPASPSPQPHSITSTGLTRASLSPTGTALPATLDIESLGDGNLSPDLAALLGRAEQRVLGARGGAVPGERLSPEAELQAVLPEDLLAALDEPLDELDRDDDDDVGTPGTFGSDSNVASRTGSRPGHESGAGTAPGGSVNPFANRDSTTSGGDRGDSPSELQPLPETPAKDLPPTTPPAMRGRSFPATSTQSGTEAGFGSMAPSMMSSRTAAVTAPPLRDEEEEEADDTGAPATIPPKQQVSTTPPRRGAKSAPPEAPQRPVEADVEIPNTLRAGDAPRVLARAVRSRYSGAIAFEDDAGIRRVVLRDGDFVVAAAGIDSESLVAFLIQRGDLAADLGARLGRKLPGFGRYAGAALIAQGHLRQEDLWPVLRGHAEWLITRIATMARGGASLERVVPPRLASEPSVFGGATGAEVLMEVVRRAVPPSDALTWLGGADAELASAGGEALLAECALLDKELELVRLSPNSTVGEIVERAGTPEFANVLFTLVELNVLKTRTGGARPKRRAGRAPLDAIDHEAVRARIQARRALVDEGDYFALLGVTKSATSYDIRRAYTSLRQEFDSGRILTPLTADLAEDVSLIGEMLDEAYEILRDQIRRDRYRRALEDSPD